MRRTKSRLKTFIIQVVVFVQITAVGLPLPVRVFAQESTLADSPATVETIYGTPPEGTPRPNGVAGHTYRYNLMTGLWENDYFTWNPNNNKTTAKYPDEKKLNSSTNNWEKWQWKYVASQGGYEYRIIATYSAAPVTTEPANPPAADAPTTPAPTPSATTQADQPQPASLNIPVNTAGSPISASLAGTQTQYDISTDINLNNDLDSSAITGNATVMQNTLAGDATSGDALAMASILNMLQSTWGAPGMLPEIYSADIQGDYFGDILINPSTLGVGSSNCGCDLQVNASIDATINNNIDILAQTGDATVSKNTVAGDASTGDATAIANIINMINSSIATGQSFLGVLNVHGNLEGDVLVADDVIDQLLAANVPTASVPLCDCGDLAADLTDNQLINNNISTTSQSGSANVNYNTKAGNASTGDAETNLTVFNLTGRTVVGENAMLVFVNVLGEWVGFITDTPGATAAMYGSGISQNTSCADCGNSTYDISGNYAINNNVNLVAASGDAEVSYNTQAGDASTGDAKASANVSNITGSNFSLSNWFGVLFINIMGNWLGSFGTDTAYGNLLAPPLNNSNPSINTPRSEILGYTTQQSTNRSVNHPSPNVRVFAASFSGDENGNPVLASMEEQSPSQTDINSGYVKQPDASNGTLSLALLVGGSLIAYLIFRRKAGSYNS